MTFPNHAETVLTGHQGPIHALAFSAGLGQYILSGSSDRSIHLYNPAKASPGLPSSGLVQTYNAHGYEILDLAVAADNARFASVGGDKQVFLWDVSTARTLRRWAGHFGRVNCVDFGGEGDSVVVSGSFDATVRIWDARSQSSKPLQVLEEARDSISSLKVEGWDIIVGSVDSAIRIYDLRMGIVCADLLGQPVTSVQQTRDGNAVLASTLDSTIRLMDKGNGQLLKSYTGHLNKDYRLRSCLGLTDAVVVSGSEDGFIYAWDLLDGRILHKLEAHAGKAASSVAWNGSQKRWASGGTDGTLVVWGMPS